MLDLRLEGEEFSGPLRLKQVLTNPGSSSPDTAFGVGGSDRVDSTPTYRSSESEAIGPSEGAVATAATALLRAQHLSVEFHVQDGVIRAVDDVALHVNHNEVVGMVGETGCGKTIAVHAIMRLIGHPGRVTSGEVVFKGRDLMQLNEAEMRKVRGREIAMIFQKPMSSMNPVFTLGEQFSDVICLHHRVSRKEALRVAEKALQAVALPDTKAMLGRYPHELSGGQQQRAMIAVALSCGSQLLIADEPTTALDVSVQLQILKLIRFIMDETRMSTLVISHDMGVIGSICDRIYVMYASRVVEHGPAEEIIECPRHPYVEGLIRSIPRFESSVSRLEHIRGEVPNPLEFPTGCRFHPRCDHPLPNCAQQMPALVEVGTEHFTACWRATDERGQA